MTRRISGSAPYPFDGDQDGNRYVVEGWPARAGGPAPDQLPVPPQPYTGAAKTTWYRINRNGFVLTGSPSEFHDPVPNFRPSTTAAEVIGLAWRVLEASLWRWRDWESTFGRTFEFLLEGDSLISEWRRWFDPNNNVEAQGRSFFVFLQGHLNLNDAQGRGEPMASNGVTMGYDNWNPFTESVSELNDLRAAAARYYFSAGSDGFTASNFARKLWDFGDYFLRVVELLLHESGHTIANAAFGSLTGGSGEWFAGPSHRTVATDIKTYQFPPAHDDKSRHYALTTGAAWWETMMRHNSRPRDRLMMLGCLCSGANNRGIFRRHPNYGSWGRDDNTCQVGAFRGYSWTTSC